MINNIPKELLNASLSNQLVIFVGSGFSKPLGFSDWNQLALKAIEEFKTDYPEVGKLKDCLDNGSLDEILIFDALYRLNPEKIENFIQEENNIKFNETNLSNHKLLWKITRKIITTNYDKTLELSKPDPTIHTICNNDKFEIAKNLNREKWLYHIHGRVDDIRNCVIFSKDYFRLYNKDDASIVQLRNIVQNQTILFIGFSMKDKYVSRMLENLNIIFDSTLNNNHFILLKKEEILSKAYLRKIEIEDYSKTQSFLENLHRAINNYGQSPIKITRYLRRRCRSFEKGTDEFNNLVTQLLLEPVAHEEKAIDLLKSQIDKLNDYERCISKAALYENLGQIENMIETLESCKFEGNKELSRLLYLAIAKEKIDYIKDAVELLDRIIVSPQESEILLCAKFNLSVCFEKLNQFEKVHFEDFIASPIILQFTNEKVKDKAIANELIVCHKTKKKFKYENFLDYELETSMMGSPKSYYKALINYLTYKNESINKSKYDEIFNLSVNMSVNSRVTILCEVYKKLDLQTQLLIKDELLFQLDKLCFSSSSKSTLKHVEELKKYMNEQKRN